MEHIVFDPNEPILRLLDQRFLPLEEKWFECRNLEEVIYSLQQMVVRGAPAIGVVAAYGCCLLIHELLTDLAWEKSLDDGLKRLAQARPTAVNLKWAVAKMQAKLKELEEKNPQSIYQCWIKYAKFLHEQDVLLNQQMGKIGAEVLKDGDTVMTHCNAGALATGGYGTALGVIRAAVEQGKKIKVIANETRPFLQGARLTCYELVYDKIEVELACDNACGFLMQKGLVDKVIVGADRIAANGDVANKIGTYSVAVLAQEHNIPFYVAAPFSTIDPLTLSGQDIPIEQRPEQEVLEINQKRIAPQGVKAINFAFDCTPARLITGIITEKGLYHYPYDFRASKTK